MFGLFSKKDKSKVLLKKYNLLIKEAYELSRINRTQSDQKTAEAEQVLKQIEEIKKSA